MRPIAFIDGRTSSDSSRPDEIDTAYLDIGEFETIAMVEVKLPPDAGDVPESQFLHGFLLKLMNDDARSQGLTDGTIELWNRHTEEELKRELTKTSEVQDCLYEHSRASWAQGK